MTFVVPASMNTYPTKNRPSCGASRRTITAVSKIFLKPLSSRESPSRSGMRAGRYGMYCQPFHMIDPPMMEASAWERRAASTTPKSATMTATVTTIRYPHIPAISHSRSRLLILGSVTPRSFVSSHMYALRAMYWQLYNGYCTAAWRSMMKIHVARNRKICMKFTKTSSAVETFPIRSRCGE